MKDVITAICPGCTIKDNEDFSPESCSRCPSNGYIINKNKDNKKGESDE